MKGKNEFTQDEANKTIALIEQKLTAGKDEQKKIRDKIRALGFHSSEFGMGPGYGYTVEDFRMVVTII